MNGDVYVALFAEFGGYISANVFNQSIVTGVALRDSSLCYE